MNSTSHEQYRDRLARSARRTRLLWSAQLAFALSQSCADVETSEGERDPAAIAELRTLVVDLDEAARAHGGLTSLRESQPMVTDGAPAKPTVYAVVIDGPSPNDPTPAQLDTEHADDAAEDAVQPLTPEAMLYDYYSLDDCRARPRGYAEVKDRYSFCRWQRVRLISYLCPTPTTCVPTGAEDVRVTVVGSGRRDRRTMQVTVALDDWQMSDGFDAPADPDGNVTVSASCFKQDGSACVPEGPNTKSVAAWKVNGEYVTEFNITGEDVDPGPHFDNDHVTYHQFEARVRADPPAYPPPSPFLLALQKFRCDTGSYFYRGVTGACLFQEQTPIMHYQRSSPTEGDVARHIEDAQKNPMSVAVPGSHMAGVVGTQWPLHRLYTMGTNYIDAGLTGSPLSAADYFTKNGDQKGLECKAFQRGPDENCDEYPFASTYEGGYYRKLNPSSESAFSVRMVSETQNKRAGGLLSGFYAREHVIAYERFFVQID